VIANIPGKWRTVEITHIGLEPKCVKEHQGAETDLAGSLWLIVDLRRKFTNMKAQKKRVNTAKMAVRPNGLRAMTIRPMSSCVMP